MSLRVCGLESLSEGQLRQLAKEPIVVLEREEEKKKEKKRKRKKFCFHLNKRKKSENHFKSQNKSLFWAESIESARLSVSHELLFLIKWENFSHSHNTWQSVEDLVECDALFRHFMSRDFQHSDESIGLYVERMSRALDNNDSALLSRLDIKAETLEIWTKGLKRGKRSDNQWYRALLVLKAMKALNIEKGFESLETFLQFSESREKTLKALKEWEKEINKQIEGKEPEIRVENNVDEEIPPKLLYLLKPKISSELKPKLKSIEEKAGKQSCQCAGDCSRVKCPCALKIYTGARHFKTSHVVYECHSSCECSSRCPNRRIQFGRNTRLSVFRSRDGRGWALRTDQKIKEKTFVMEYIGEVLSSHETRGRDSQYFFSVDSEFSGQTFFVDGKREGNVTRFANHCCEPNLDVHLVWVSGLDCIPRIAFFANRRIESGEELTYDYNRSVRIRDRNGEYVFNKDISSRDSSQSIECLCKSKKCRKMI